MKRAALLAGLLALTGCSGKSAEKPTTAAAPKLPPTTTATTATTQTCSQFQGSTGTHASATTPTKTMLLTLVRTGADRCTDRVTFIFRPAGGETPGYRVQYRPAAQAQTQDASGKHIAIAGKAFLVVRLEPAATADLSGSRPENTYTGSSRLEPPGMRAVREVVKTGDFEGVLTWVIGLSSERPFTVTSSASPTSLTVVIG